MSQFCTLSHEQRNGMRSIRKYIRNYFADALVTDPVWHDPRNGHCLMMSIVVSVSGRTEYIHFTDEDLDDECAKDAIKGYVHHVLARSSRHSATPS